MMFKEDIAGSPAPTTNTIDALSKSTPIIDIPSDYRARIASTCSKAKHQPISAAMSAADAFCILKPGWSKSIQKYSSTGTPHEGS